MWPEAAPAIAAGAQALMDQRTVGPVPESEWPHAITELLHPESVRVAPEGVYIATSRRFVEEDGVFVARDASSIKVGKGSDPEYRLVAENVFTYSVRG